MTKWNRKNNLEISQTYYELAFKKMYTYIFFQNNVHSTVGLLLQLILAGISLLDRTLYLSKKSKNKSE